MADAHIFDELLRDGEGDEHLVRLLITAFSSISGGNMIYNPFDVSEAETKCGTLGGYTLYKKMVTIKAGKTFAYHNIDRPRVIINEMSFKVVDGIALPQSVTVDKDKVSISSVTSADTIIILQYTKEMNL